MPYLKSTEKGWLKLWRKSEKTKAFCHAGTWRLWTYCMIKANYQEENLSVEGVSDPVLVKPGQFITKRSELTRELGYPQNKATTVWSWLKKLEKWRNLNIKSYNKFSLITIVNWKSYQGDDDNLIVKADSDNPTLRKLPEKTSKEIDKLIIFYKDKFPGHIKRWGMNSIFKMRDLIEGAALDGIPLEVIKNRISRASKGTPWEIIGEKWVHRFKDSKLQDEKLQKLEDVNFKKDGKDKVKKLIEIAKRRQ